MVVLRCIHKSHHKLEVGTELVPPRVLAERDDQDAEAAIAYANFQEYCDGQHDNVYFSQPDSWAEDKYGHGPHKYVVEPLGQVETDPEDINFNGVLTGSLRAERARIVEVLA